jgi:GNAT superfamily N-acetyltransferase
MIAVETQVTILPVSFADILDAPNSAALIQAYATECLVSGAHPQRAAYEAMEKAGALKCFGAYIDSRLIGFCSVLSAVMPHTGHRLATIESVFVDPAYRNMGADADLLGAAEQYAAETGCRLVTALARVGSAYDKVLSRRSGYTLTHSQHTRWLA